MIATLGPSAEACTSSLVCYSCCFFANTCVHAPLYPPLDDLSAFFLKKGAVVDLVGPLPQCLQDVVKTEGVDVAVSDVGIERFGLIALRIDLEQALETAGVHLFVAMGEYTAGVLDF